MRFLCLHGMGSNACVFESQTAPLRYLLSSHQFEFVEGLIPHPQAPEIKDIFPADEDYYAYFNHEAETVMGALSDLDEYIRDQGPLDGLLGFSQGALLVATYLAHRYPEADRSAYRNIKCAVFICGTPPWQVVDGKARTVEEALDGHVIAIPTVHILGSKDPKYEQSIELTKVCDDKGRRVVEHQGGHEIPRASECTEKFARAIEDVVERALFTQ